MSDDPLIVSNTGKVAITNLPHEYSGIPPDMFFKAGNAAETSLEQSTAT